MFNENQSLKAYNTFAIDATADYFVTIHNINEAKEVLSQPIAQDNKIFILGGGSNILFKSNVTGLVIRNDIKGIKTINEDDNHVWLKIGAGENWHELVMYCVEKQYAGIENLSLIPGTVGAAPLQNIGAYGIELCSVFDSLEALSIKDAKLMTFNNDDCQFGYRSSIFKEAYKNQFIICNVTLKLFKKPEMHLNYGRVRRTLDMMGIKQPTLKDVSDAVIKIRQDNLADPDVLPNAGSFFKNPQLSQADFKRIEALHPNIPRFPGEHGTIKIPAAWLIQRCDWKGKKHKNVGVYENHALVIVNHNNATSEEVLELAKMIEDSVFEKYGVRLTPEVNII